MERMEYAARLTRSVRITFKHGQRQLARRAFQRHLQSSGLRVADHVRHRFLSHTVQLRRTAAKWSEAERGAAFADVESALSSARNVVPLRRQPDEVPVTPSAARPPGTAAS
jgi:hypothetical protein